MAPYIGGSIFLVIAIGCGIRGAHNRRIYRAGKKQPLLLNVTASELAAIPVTWPLDVRRWPPPWSQGNRVMEVQFAHAYSLLADRIRRNLLLAAEIALVLGSAWLGVTIDDIWVDYRDASAEATEHLQARSNDFAAQLPTWEAIAHLLPAVVIAVGAICHWVARDYETVERVYREAAVSKATAVSLTTESRATGVSRFIELLIRRSRHV